MSSIPVIISLLSLCLAIWAYLLTKRHKSYDFIFELNKLMIANPALWTIYDGEKDNFTGANPEEEKLKGMIKAQCYYIMNNYELILVNESKKNIAGWKRYIVNLVNNSAAFRKWLDKEMNGEIFGDTFKKNIEVLLKDTNYRTVVELRPVDNQPTPKDT